MHRRSLVLTALLGVLIAAPAARAQRNAAPVNISIYRGSTDSITLGSWGSGKAEPSRDVVLIGDNAIRVTTEGLYQGARLDFQRPVDLSAAFANPRTYIRMQVRFSGQNATQQVYDEFSGETRSGAAAPFDRMRFLLTMADGTRYEVVRPIELKPSDDPDAWTPIAFPLAALLKKPGGASMAAPPTGDAARMAQMAIFGDKYQQFYIGEINVITDETEINVVPLEEQIAFVNNLISFTAEAEGGASTLRYSWDLDGDKKEDRTGRTIQHYWRKAGKYPVTLTVSDVDGLKKPASTTVLIDVGE